MNNSINITHVRNIQRINKIIFLLRSDGEGCSVIQLYYKTSVTSWGKICKERDQLQLLQETEKLTAVNFTGEEIVRRICLFMGRNISLLLIR
jgi:hypothetical protein